MKSSPIYRSLLLASAVAAAMIPAVLPLPAIAEEQVQSLEVQYSHQAPLFTDSFELALTAAVGVTLHYTTDGSIPDGNSAIYSAPLAISSSKSHYIKVVAKATDGTLGEVTSQSFTPVNSSITNFHTKLPIIVIERHDEGTIVDEPKTPSIMSVISQKSGNYTEIMAAPELSVRIGIETRGSTSQKFAKKQFSVETRDELDEDKDVEILGMPEDSDWILFGASEIDRALGVRNAFMYQLSNDMGRYAPRTKFVEVFVKKDNAGQLDYDDHYRGVYVVIEKIKRGDDRVDIKKTKGSKLGGWIVANDRDFDNEGFRTHKGNPKWVSEGGDACCDARIVPVYPKVKNFYDSPAESYVKDWLNDFEGVLYGSDFKNKDTGYNQYINTGSFVDFHILNTLAKNIDGLRLSTFMHKQKGKKLKMGPIWDFNISMDSKDWRDNNPEGWNGEATKPNGDTTRYFKHDFWWKRLFSDADFTMEWIERWFELRQQQLSDDLLLDLFTATANQLGSSAADRNYKRWGFKPSNGFDGEVADTKQWLQTRVNWIDSQFYGYPELSVDEAGLVRLSHNSSHPIYFTLDGSDPRLAGGALSGSAIEYNSYDKPILSTGTTITARLYNKDSSRKSPYSPSVSYTVAGAKAVISSIPSTVLIGEEITLDASDSKGEELSYEWSNGSTDASQSLSFELVGDYDFSVTVVDNQGEIDSASVSVSVLDNYTPVANAGGDINILIGETAQFDASGSNDANDSIVSYQWSNDLTGETASKVYDTAGNYQVTLTVTDEQGATATDTLTVTVSEESFTSTFTNLYFRGTANGWNTTAMNLIADNTWQIEATFADESNPRFKLDVFGDWSTNYGDNGSDGDLDSSGRDIQVSNNSSYRITVNDQNLSYTVEQIGLPNQTPIADAGNDMTVLVNDLINLSGAASQDLDGDIVDYQWSNGLEGSEVEASYNLTGTYEVTLTVTDDEGLSASDSITVTVVDNYAPVADAGNDIQILVGETAQFDASASSDANGTITDYQWSNALNGETASLLYSTAGNYNVTLTVTDNQGATSTDVVTVTVIEESFNSVFNQPYLRGTNNGWGTTPMTLVADNTWQVEAEFGSASDERFKFDVYGDWSFNIGDYNNNGWAKRSEDSIVINQGAGTYRITFNDSGNGAYQYSIVKL